MIQAKRTLTTIAASFAMAGIVIVGLLATIDLGEARNPDLADGANLTAAVFGVVGLSTALIWLSRSGEREHAADSLTMGFIIRVAVAELGLLMGIVGLFMTGSMTAPYIGLGFFLLSLVVLMGVLRRATGS